MSNLWRWLPRAPRPKVGRGHIAMFIDGDGTSSVDAERAIKWVLMRGRISILRVYGNYTGRAATAWTGVIRRYGLVARYLPNLAPGKNAADIAMTIDATEALLNRDIDTIVLIAGDSDFVPLALRIKEAGKEVIGLGHKSTAKAFRSACSEFYELRSLEGPSQLRAPVAALWSLSPNAAEAFIVEVLRCVSADGEPVLIGTLGKKAAELDPNFDTRVFSRRNLSELVRDIPSLETIELDGKRYVRLAPSSG